MSCCPFCRAEPVPHPSPEWADTYLWVEHRPDCWFEVPTLIPLGRLDRWNHRPVRRRLVDDLQDIRYMAQQAVDEPLDHELDERDILWTVNEALKGFDDETMR